RRKKDGGFLQPGVDRPVQTLQVRDERRENHAGGPLELFEQRIRVRQLRDPFRRDERGHFDPFFARGNQCLDQLDLVAGGEGPELVLQAVARPYFVHVGARREVSHPAHGRGWIFSRIHFTISCVELPGVKISATPAFFRRGMSSSGMMPPPKTETSSAFCFRSSSSTAGKRVM